MDRNMHVALAAALLLALITGSASQAEDGTASVAHYHHPNPPPDKPDNGLDGDPFTKRQVVYLDVGSGYKFPLKFPRMKPLDSTAESAIDVDTLHMEFRLTVNDTCGLFTILHVVHEAVGGGPPPHIHYNEDEYFIAAGTGSTRLYTYQKSEILNPGKLPGFNRPAIKMGSAVLTGSGNGVDKYGGQLLLSPGGSVHYFARETNVTDFFTVYFDGFADAGIINFFVNNPDATAQELLYYSGVYGIPHDTTGRFVGLYSEDDPEGTKKLYRQARGPVDVPNPYRAAKRLQAAFDAVEQRRCCKACL